MVRNKKTGLGRVADNGSSTGRRSHSERPPNKDHKSLSSIRQRESEVFSSSKEAIRQLNVSALTQAFKDLCSGKIKDHKYEWSLIMDWIESEFFEEVCHCADVEVDNTRKIFRELYDMPLRIRQDLVKKRRVEAGVKQ